MDSDSTTLPARKPKNLRVIRWYDRARRKYVLRQFHGEGIVNTYHADSADVGAGQLMFETEAIENFRNGWKAREVYSVLNDRTFVETFFLASPGMDFVEYVRNTFRRVR